MDEVLMNFIALFLFFFFSFVIIHMLIKPRKSKEYRKLITDMYVASKTRKLADEDKLDLNKEEKLFKEWCRKERNKNPNNDLDDTIEEELKENVGEVEIG